MSTLSTPSPTDSREAILAAAVMEFGEHGLTGARVDAIALRAGTNKRLIYYYFTDKAGLYLAALESAYARVRQQELELDLSNLDPVTALRRLVTVNFDHHVANEHYIRMVMSENMNRGRTLALSQHMAQLNRPALSILGAIYEQGVNEQRFRPGLDVTELHASISALTFYNVSNRYTFGLIFQQNTSSPAYLAARREHIIDMILRFVLRQPD